mgnify:CR=1 FL=1
MAMQRVIGRHLLECVVGQHYGLPCESVGSVILAGAGSVPTPNFFRSQSARYLVFLSGGLRWHQ